MNMAKKPKPITDETTLLNLADKITINGMSPKIPLITADDLTINKWEPISSQEFAERIHEIAAPEPYGTTPMAVPVSVVMDNYDYHESATLWFKRGILDDRTWKPSLLSWSNPILKKFRCFTRIE